jgi:hypothetical protein
MGRYFFQKFGMKRMMIVYTSSLPVSMQKMRTHFAAAGKPA